MPAPPFALNAPPLAGVNSTAPDKAPLARTVRGPRKAVAAACVAARVAWLAVGIYRNPLRAARAIVRLRATMRQWPATTPPSARLLTSHPCVRSSGRYFWDLYLPGWPSRAFDRCVERELDRVDPIGRPPALQTAIIAITSRCTLRCEHCFEWDALDRAETLSSDELHELVRRVRERGAAQIFFSGGEPMQRFADLLVLAESVSAETDVWILTSGLGLSADRARRLRDAGVTGIALSLDHWDASSHDQFRGTPGAFESARRAATHARQAGLLMALSLCPTRSFVNEENLEGYATTARAFGASFIQILEPKAVGRYADGDVALAHGEQRLLERFCERLNTADPSLCLPSVRYLDWSARTFGCCGAGDRYVYVNTAGELQPCPFCRSGGVRLLDHDIHSAISSLQRTGCPTAAAPSSTARSTP